MTAVSKILAGGVAIASLASAAPAAAQYYPGYGGGNVVSQVLNQVFGGYGTNGYNSNTRLAVQRCAAAVEQRIGGGFGGYNSGYGYGGYGGYGGAYGGRGGGRVLGITHADQHFGGIFKVRGVATSGSNAGYGGYGGYGGNGYAQQGADLTFTCDVDYRGYVRKLHIDRNPNNYGYNGYNGYTGYNGYSGQSYDNDRDGYDDRDD